MSEPQPEPGAQDAPRLLVFLHGLGETPLVWQDQVVAMAPGWQPLTPWIAGTKPTDSGAFDLGAAVDALARLPQLHGVQRISLCGRSLGAAVAIRLAADHPELVDRLVLVDPLLGLPGWARASQRMAVKLMPRSRLADRNIDKDRLLAAIDALGRVDVTGRLGEVRAASLVLADGADERAVRLVERGLPDGRYARLGDGGLNAAIWEFLEPA
ncbi:pimeloyl-ACP methyl ester carboxylesterase [Naumannella cuiyingiana]|uniref:Pimeloyl-ACP methyl ester carboxylesterase n=1 Tax=Naumannella cuiyingiana TaxID=1347891 RepID=A0A7Z0IJL6_9ACTN|nr:pimeloyl-ACP methyl ester carboxylesterase [Naumannella cuiyingiana]